MNPQDQYDRSTSTTEYYGNHDPYLAEKPRPRGEHRKRWATAKLTVALSALVVLTLMELPIWSGLSSIVDRTQTPPAAVADAPDPDVWVISSEVVDLDIGESFSIGCNFLEPRMGACMTVTLEDVDPEDRCQGEVPADGRYARVTLSATMLEGADEGFVSPFRVPLWAALTEDGDAWATRSEFPCESGAMELSRLAEVPGATATGSYWLPVPEDANVVQFSGYAGPMFRVPVALPGVTAP